VTSALAESPSQVPVVPGPAAPWRARGRRVLKGFLLPFHMLRALWRDPAARKLQLEVLAIELAIVVPLTLAVAAQMDDVEHAFAHAHDWRARFRGVGVYAAEVYTVCVVLQWVVYAFARDHHDLLEVHAAGLTGAPFDPLRAPPRIRLDFAWMWRRAKRRIRGALLFASGLPIAAVVLLTPRVGHWLYVAVAGAWGIYWTGVFAIGKSFAAWRTPVTREPWFLRWTARLARIPVLGWPAALYLRIWRRVTRGVLAPCVTFEALPYEAAGLAVAKLVLGVPVVWLASRAAFGPAATHAMIDYAKERAGEAPPPPRYTWPEGLQHSTP
jgi:hypothetical protein